MGGEGVKMHFNDRIVNEIEKQNGRRGDEGSNGEGVVEGGRSVREGNEKEWKGSWSAEC